jgi:membrane protease YdiL (CAAX protease family)
MAAFTSGFLAAVAFVGVGAVLDVSLTITGLLLEIGSFVGVVLYLAATGRRLPEVLRLGSVPAAAYFPALLLGFVLLAANFSATVLLGPPVQDMEFVAGAESAAERLVLVVGVALLAPVIEEALFRGLLQGVLEDRFRPWLAIALAAAPFALLHGLPHAIFFLFWSLPLGWLTWRTGSIRPAVVVHAVNNLVGVVGLLSTGSVEPEALERSESLVVLALALLPVVVLFTLGLCRQIDRVVRGSSPKQTPPWLRNVR